MLTSDCVISVLPHPVERIFIAYSGGVDSHVLLHLCCSIVGFKSKITAVYIHHGLQQEADQWALHCQSTAFALGVDFQCLKVNAKRKSGESLEEVARDARYHALKPLLAKNDVLLLAQHGDDQLETVLLQLFRGAGVQGLSGMPHSIPFGAGLMCRPFLNTPKQQIDTYARQHKLAWVEDSSNQDNKFDRNYLRNTILPRLKQRWPAVAKTVSRSARHCASSHLLNQQLARELLSSIAEGDRANQTLNIPGLIELESHKQTLLIRQWFAEQQLRMPSEKVVEKVINEVCKAQRFANPEMRGKDYCLKRYRDTLYCLKSTVIDLELHDQIWFGRQMNLQLSDEQQLILSIADQGILKERWLSSLVEVRFRKGGEKIRLQGREGHHSLKKIYQELGVPPWERDGIPLIYLDGKLAVVVGVVVSADFFCEKNSECYQLQLQKNRLA